MPTITDAVARYAVGWLALVAWTIVAFSAFERVRPRHHHHPRVRDVALAAGLLAVNVGIAQLIVRTVAVRGGHVVVGWLVAEVLAYGLHRAMHRVPLLWRFHRLHHSRGSLAWTTTWLIHPIDAALTAASGVLAAVLVGGGLPSAVWFVVGRRVWAIALHANVAWPAGTLDRVIATPAFHERHHREDLEPANFASTLPVLDCLFGSYRPGRIAAR